MENPQVAHEKDSEGNWVSARGFSFDTEKLKRIARKYGYDFATFATFVHSSEGVQAPKSMEKTGENNVENSPGTLPLNVANVANVANQTLLTPPSNISKNPMK